MTEGRRACLVTETAGLGEAGVWRGTAADTAGLRCGCAGTARTMRGTIGAEVRVEVVEEVAPWDGCELTTA